MDRPQRPQRPQGSQRPQNPQNPQGQRNVNAGYQQNPYQQQQNMNQGMQNNQQVDLSKGQNMTDEQYVMMQLEEAKRKKKKIILTVLCVIVGLAVLGVGTYFIATGRISSRVTGLEAEVAKLQQTITDNNAKHAEEVSILQKAVADTTVKELVPTTSLQRVEATNVPELWLQEGDFIADKPLEIPTTTDAVNDTFIQIGPKFIIRPSDRWLMVSQGTTIEFSHPQKIWGKIRALTIKEAIPESSMKNMITNFFVGYPATTIQYRKIFLDNKVAGMIGNATVTVNYEVPQDVEYEEAVEMEVDVPIEYEEEVEVPYMETVTNEDGTTTEVEKTRKEMQTVTKMEKKKTTVMEKKTRSEVSIVQKDMTINVGFVNKNNNVLSFLFVNDSEGGSNSQELINLLLSSCAHGSTGGILKLE